MTEFPDKDVRMKKNPLPLTEYTSSKKSHRLSCYFLILFPLGLLGVSMYVSHRIIHPPRYILNDTPSDYGLDWEAIQFQNDQGITLKGWFIRGKNDATIILLHGFGKSRWEVFQQAIDLNKAGFSTLLFDFRESGESGESMSTLGITERLDLQAAVHYLLSRDDVNANKIGIFGFSMGGAVAIWGAAEIPQIQAAVVHGTFARADNIIPHNYRRLTLGLLPYQPFGWLTIKLAEIKSGVKFSDFAPVDFVGKISPRPILIILGEKDDRMPISEAKSLYNHAGEPKELWLIPNVDHFNVYEQAGNAYSTRLIYFFKRHLNVD